MDIEFLVNRWRLFMLFGMVSITAEQLADRLREGPVPRLIDVREAEEWAINRLPGAEHVALGEVPTRLPGMLGREEEVVVYCHHGVRSAMAQAWLMNQGFGKVVNLEGGIDAWAQRVDPSMVRY